MLSVFCRKRKLPRLFFHFPRCPIISYRLWICFLSFLNCIYSVCVCAHVHMCLCVFVHVCRSEDKNVRVSSLTMWVLGTELVFRLGNKQHHPLRSAFTHLVPECAFSKVLPALSLWCSLSEGLSGYNKDPSSPVLCPLVSDLLIFALFPDTPAASPPPPPDLSSLFKLQVWPS